MQNKEDLSDAMSDVQEASVSEGSVECPILVFAPQYDSELALASLRGGARGFVHAWMKSEQILRALSVVAKGERAVPRELLEFVLAEADSTVENLDALTGRQREVLELVDEGLTNAQIARSLFLSESTIKQHLRGAYKILGVNSRTQAAQLQYRAD